ncbi:Uncharacterised protein [Mycobacteroides abscessus subsp. abscessus]|nr:Uncharacterised protein [Mycobacteroides abscessus subsp. abscessus]
MCTITTLRDRRNPRPASSAMMSPASCAVMI